VQKLCSTLKASVPIKRLLVWADMAAREVRMGRQVPLDRWQQMLQDLTLHAVGSGRSGVAGVRMTP
jgi:hypothetical protein